jgi:hypothetical protein
MGGLALMGILAALASLRRRGGECARAVARSLARAGAGADELCLTGVERRGVLAAGVGRTGGGEGFLARKSSRACAPPAMERMSRGPWGDGTIWMMQLVESGGRLSERSFSLVGRLAATKGRRSLEKILF